MCVCFVCVCGGGVGVCVCMFCFALFVCLFVFFFQISCRFPWLSCHFSTYPQFNFRYFLTRNPWWKVEAVISNCMCFFFFFFFCHHQILSIKFQIILSFWGFPKSPSPLQFPQVIQCFRSLALNSAVQHISIAQVQGLLRTRRWLLFDSWLIQQVH